MNELAKLLAGLRRQSAGAFAELVAAQERDGPELKRMLADMARASQLAYEQIQADSTSHQVP